jgi:hypothetical protein
MSVLFGYSILPSINSVFSGGLAFFSALLLSIKNITEPITQIFKGIAPRNILLKNTLNVLKISILPLFLFFIFLLIFQNANPIFEEKTVFLQNLITLFLKKFPTFSFGRTMFTLVGFVFLNAVFFRKELFFGLGFLTNQEIKLQPSTEPASNSKFQTAFLTLILLNLLLVFVNAIDIKYLWFNFENTTAPEMSKLVHSGTYLLIFSVLLSILVLIFFFNSDLNFHKKNKWVSILSFAWIGQNILLLFSVYIRN